MTPLPVARQAAALTIPKPALMHDVLSGRWPERAAVLSDLDGCLISGETVLPGVRDFFARAGNRLWILSNNSSDTGATLSARLALLGLTIPPERILLAGEDAVRNLAASCPGSRAAIFAAPVLRDLARDLGLRLTGADADADVALLARDPGFNMADLARLMRLVHQGVPLWLANPDPTHPAADGAPVPETGALFAALRAGFPALKAPCRAKPGATMLLTALARAGVAPDQAVFLGDTDATDGAAARAAGVPFILLARPGTHPGIEG